ncbi:substrate-binding periplasmic protein [Spirochaeta isovalerica]|uniref:ABC-type amino acid transport substrate-binding protein n=1 Tax=Spirochaeta isovalerica TaxID=150 RepID=A0A841R8Z3_9SPIO|nr:transporter substrate-binding domain-containing protein [Spirochaeta isovalerica]MBB6479647.1 ABC-type amino acid transport substrate-binding protein [Spirochaeta isovalerica]
MNFRPVLLLIFIFSIFVFSSYGDVVNVGGYIFPPFVVEESNEVYTGLTIDLIRELNRLQDKYTFRFVETTSKRRYEHLLQGRFDIMFFEEDSWGWTDYPVSFSRSFLKGGEVFIARAEPGRDQIYFENISDKTIAVILGYHYGFVDFNSDEAYMNSLFHLQFSRDHRINIEKVLQGVADLSIVTQTYLKTLLKEEPELGNRLLVSVRYDQKYDHTVLVRTGSPVSVIEINSLLDELIQKNILSRVLSKYGIE